MTKMLFFLFFLSLNICTASEAVRDILHKNLDPSIVWLLKNKPTEQEALKKIGAPALVEKDTKYYALHQHKYSLAIKFQNNKLSYMSYRLPYDAKISLYDFQNIIKNKDLKTYPDQGHEKEKYISTNLKKDKLQLLFNNNSSKTLNKIIYGRP